MRGRGRDRFAGSRGSTVLRRLVNGDHSPVEPWPRGAAVFLGSASSAPSVTSNPSNAGGRTDYTGVAEPRSRRPVRAHDRPASPRRGPLEQAGARPTGGALPKIPRIRSLVSERSSRGSTRPDTGRPLAPRALADRAARGGDPSEGWVKLVSPGNPLLAREPATESWPSTTALASRHGDGFSAPTHRRNAQLLDALAADFVAHATTSAGSKDGADPGLNRVLRIR